MLARNLMMGAARQPTFVSYASGSNLGFTTVTVNKPADIVDGDTLVAILSGSDGVPMTWTMPAGWTERLDQNAIPNICVATKTAASEGASYVFTSSSPFPALVGQIIALRNVQYDTIGSVGTRSNAGDIAIPGITLADIGILIAIAAGDNYNVTHTTPAGMTLTERTSENAQGDISGFYESVAAGATGTRTTTFGAGTASNAGVLVGFKAL